MKQRRVLVVGSSNLDLSIYCDRLPGSGETLLGGNFASAIGGKGANQATAASRAGADILFVSAIGEDAQGEQIRAFFSAEGIETRWIATGKQEPTGIAVILVDKQGNNSIVVAQGANAAITPSDMGGIPFHTCSHVLVSLEIPMDVVMEVARRARAAGCVVVLNPAPAATLPDELLRHVNILVPNEHEVGVIAAGADAEKVHAEAARKFFEMGGDSLIITLGRDGAKVICPSCTEIVSGREVTAVDTVGAGDCFCGVFVASLAAGQPLLDAIRIANHAAALSVQKRGAIPSYPYAEMIHSAPSQSPSGSNHVFLPTSAPMPPDFQVDAVV